MKFPNSNPLKGSGGPGNTGVHNPYEMLEMAIALFGYQL